MKFLLAVVAIAAFAHADKHDGEQLFEITPATEQQLKMVQEALKMYEEIFDVWNGVHKVGDTARLLVPAQYVQKVVDGLKEGGIPYVQRDVQELVDYEKFLMELEKLKFNGNGFDYETYNRFDDIINELNRLAGVYSQASTFTVGKTYQGRTLVGLKISSGGNKPVIWIDGGIHAREWISPATVMYFTKLVLENPSQYSTILDNYDLYLLPVFNADGYEYSHTNYRLWRKTRSPQSGGCYGVDPNRNWDAEWSRQIGTSRSPCRDTYSGPYANSEKCVIAVSKYLTQLKNTVGLASYYNVHAYSQLVLTPWSWTSTYPKDYAEIKRVGDAFKNGVAKRYGTRYRVGPPPRILYGVSGGSIDFTYQTLGVVYSYALELRDTGRYGFVLPPNQIKPSGLETADAFLAAVTAMQGKKATGSPPTQNPNCVDKRSYCPRYKAWCQYSSIYKMCPKTCGKC